MVSKTLRWGAVISFVGAMLILLIGGRYALHKVPPYPDSVVAGDQTIMTRDSIMRGQTVYQRYGLMDHGSVWGHGSLRGNDFSAQTLHLLGEYERDYYSRKNYGGDYMSLGVADRGAVDALVRADIKTNTYNPDTGALTVSAAKWDAIQKVKKYWDKIFRYGDDLYGYLPNTVPTGQQREDIGDFFFWTAWAAGTNRPGLDYTYTNNWPPDRSVYNVLPRSALLWSLFGIMSLFITLGLVIFIVHRYRFFYGEPKLVELAAMLAKAPVSNSQRKAAKYLVVVVLLFIVQILMGGLLAHYTVHPGTFYYQAIAKFIPFSWVKSWHLQLGIFWIAVSWVGSALYLAPLIGGREPKKQGLLVDILFIAILIVAVGSLTGEVLGIKNLLGDKIWFWFGHQGWEYLELGRFWQILLFSGLVIWLLIAYRALAGRLMNKDEKFGGLAGFYTFSAVAVVLFFSFGLFYGPHTHLTVADYWRWFVVHIWVESVFEFFAAASIALLLTTVGLVTKESALRAAYLTAILAFLSGIVGTAHHYYWYGGPDVWVALGSVFSSLEPIPLILLVVRGWIEYKSISSAGENFPYKWPLMFLSASTFWNFLGAGVFGFLINLPIINYYEHATYLTANHGHTALFGTYGMLGIAMCLFTWRGLVREERWNDGLIKLSFYGLNVGLFTMFLFTLLPVGILQTLDVYNYGAWYGKSAAFFNKPIIQFIGQIRMIPDTIIIVLGAFPLALFFLKAFFNMKPAQVKDGEAIQIGGKDLPI